MGGAKTVFVGSPLRRIWLRNFCWCLVATFAVSAKSCLETDDGRLYLTSTATLTPTMNQTRTLTPTPTITQTPAVTPTPTNTPISYQVTTTVTGLGASKTLVLRELTLGASSDLSFTSNSSQAFAVSLASGTTYRVKVQNQPTGQVCASAAGVGVLNGPVTVTFTCITSPMVRSTSLTDCRDVHDVLVSGSYLYVVDATCGLFIYSLGLSPPTLVGSYTSSMLYSYKIVLSGNYAFIAHGSSGLTVLNVTDKANPTHVSTLQSTGSVFIYDLALSGNNLFLADYYNGMTVYDIAAPTAPSFVATKTGLGSPSGIKILGSYAYVVSTGGFYILNIANPAASTILSTTVLSAGLGYRLNLELDNSYAYVPAGTAGLKVISITDPVSPVVVATWAGASVVGVHKSGSTLYTASLAAGLYVVDVTSPTSPVELNHYTPPGAYTTFSTSASQVLYTGQTYSGGSPGDPGVLIITSVPGL